MHVLNEVRVFVKVARADLVNDDRMNCLNNLRLGPGPLRLNLW
jgi:hypothetical protein